MLTESVVNCRKLIRTRSALSYCILIVLTFETRFTLLQLTQKKIIKCSILPTTTLIVIITMHNNLYNKLADRLLTTIR